MNVLSLFDGISACRLALERAGHKVDNYYTAEIDKYAQQISKKNYPDAIQLGDVTGWHFWTIDWSSIDLVTGGFPCQAWSVAGKQLGDKDERGFLFWHMLDIMQYVLHHNPKAKFLIENVKMKKEFEQYITHHTEQALGKVEKHLINSALVSAQNRQRYYWTNIQDITQPEDKGILLRDVIEGSGRGLNRNQNQTAIIYSTRENPRIKGVTEDDRGVRPHQGDKAKSGVSECGRILKLQADKTDTLTTNHAPKLLTDRHDDGDGVKYRKLTPIECERLQTFPDGWTEGVSNTQRYKALGNAWTVDVIAHIFGCLK